MLYVVGFIVSPQNLCPPGTSEWDLIWKLGFHKSHQLRSHCFRASPNFNEWCLCKIKEREIQIERQRNTQGRGLSNDRDQGTTRTAEKLRRVKEGFFPRAFRENMALLVP